MNFIIDIRSLLELYWSGVSWHTYYLTDNLLKIDKENQYFLFYNQFKINNKNTLLHCCFASLLQKIFYYRENHQFNQAISKWRQYPNVKIIACHYPNKIFNLSMRFLKYPKIDQIVKKAVIREFKKQAKNNSNEAMKQWNNKTIFFAPNLNFIALSKTAKLILTIHDLSFKRFPEFFSRQMRLWHQLVNPKKLCQCANKIIAVSASSKNDLIQLYNLQANKIKVVYPGLDPRFKIIQNQEKLKQAQKKYALPDNFILAVGALEPRKNLEAAIKAFELLLSGESDLSNRNALAGDLTDSPNFWQNKKDLNLVIVGGYGFKHQKILFLPQKSKLADKIKIIKPVGHQDLPYIYNLAQAFLYLSFYEGFGLPPIEAMACGLPVIASYAPALPEILADSALLVDPHNISETVFALKQILSDDNLRHSLIKKGLEKTKQFDWEKTADQVLRLMRLGECSNISTKLVNR